MWCWLIGTHNDHAIYASGLIWSIKVGGWKKEQWVFVCITPSDGSGKNQFKSTWAFYWQWQMCDSLQLLPLKAVKKRSSKSTLSNKKWMWNHWGNQSWLVMMTSKVTLGYLWASSSNWSVSESSCASIGPLSCLLNTGLDCYQLGFGNAFVRYGISTLYLATDSSIPRRRRSHIKERVVLVLCFYYCGIVSTVISSAAVFMLDLWHWLQTR